MAMLQLGNESVIEKVKKDPGLDDSPDNVVIRARGDLGRRVTSMFLHETDIDDKPSRSMNLAAAIRFWAGESDKPPVWVDGDDDLLVALVADHFDCPTGRPKNWKEG